MKYTCVALFKNQREISHVIWEAVLSSHSMFCLWVWMPVTHTAKQGHILGELSGGALRLLRQSSPQELWWACRPPSSYTSGFKPLKTDLTREFGSAYQLDLPSSWTQASPNPASHAHIIVSFWPLCKPGGAKRESTANAPYGKLCFFLPRLLNLPKLWPSVTYM